MIISIAGPTASGKTETAVKLAVRIDGEIISSDAMQIYKGMDIGTAKASPQERSEAVHHLTDIIKPDEVMSSADFLILASAAAEDILARGKIPVITGGSGLYHDSLIYSSYDYSAGRTDPQLRRELESEAEIMGNVYMHERLRAADPEYAAGVHPNNSRRVIRALEYFILTNQKKSAQKKQRTFRFEDTLSFGLFCERSVIYERINRRTDLMMKNGLEDEVRRLYEAGYDKKLPSMQAIGYKELIDYFESRVTLSEAVGNIKRLSRNYAKRQMTWFGRNEDIFWIDTTKKTSDETVQIIEEKISEFNDNRQTAERDK